VDFFNTFDHIIDTSLLGLLLHLACRSSCKAMLKVVLFYLEKKYRQNQLESISSQVGFGKTDSPLRFQKILELIRKLYHKTSMILTRPTPV